MKDLEEAIKHAEEVAEENEKSSRRWKECKNRGTVGWSDYDKEQVDMSIARCSKCATEHRQLAEWLKDYKRLLVLEPCEDAISREDALMCLTGEYLDDKQYNPEDIISKQIRRIKALPPVLPEQKTGHWIPVSSGKLPEEDMTVIGTTNYDDVYKTELYDDCGEKKWHSNGNFDVPIVAWMPSPEPYKVEAEVTG